MSERTFIKSNHIDKVINFHKKNLNTDIILPNLKVSPTNNTNIIKIVTNKKTRLCIFLEQIYLMNLKRK